jgi:signal transduction histidine kinase/CheY-like chemotaxis protein
MKLQTKIAFSILPLFTIAIFALGGWSIVTVNKAIRTTNNKQIIAELQSYLNYTLTEFHNILVKHQLTDVDSFVKEYQEQAFLKTKEIHFLPSSHLLIFNESGQLLHNSHALHSIDIASWITIVNQVKFNGSALQHGTITTEIGAHSYVAQMFPPWKWVVLYVISTDELKATENRLRNATIVVALICVLSGFILILLIFRHFYVSPVKLLQDTANAVKKHQHITSIPIYTKDEIGDLARSMENMAYSIEEFRHEKEHFQRHLKSVVKQRTKELFETNAVLKAEIESRKLTELELKHANRVKSEFLANMSHEIRTPLNAVIGFSELLSSLVSDPKQKDYISSIKVAGKSLLVLINDILDLSKIEAEMLEIHLELTDPVLMFKEIQQIFSVRISEKFLDFDVDIDPEIPEALLLDKPRLRQVLLNLVGNAIKFTKEGYVKIRVRQEPNEQDLSKINLVILVEDTGIGISDQHLKSVFESFKQASIEVGHQYGGTGLGLTISKRLIELMNGKISVNSEIGKGSQFKITLKDVSISALKSAKEMKQSLSLEDIKFHKGKILIIDDVESNRFMIRELLEKINLKVYEAHNGQQGVEKAKQIQPDLILMDIRMPVMNGIDAAKMIKADSKIKETVVIALTASTRMDEVDEKTRKLFFNCLSKPINVKELLRDLTYCLPYDQVAGATLPEDPVKLFQQDLEQIRNLNQWDIIHKLTDQLMHKSFELQGVMNMRDLEKFVKSIIQLSKECDLNGLEAFGLAFSEFVQNYDINKINFFLKTMHHTLKAL